MKIFDILYYAVYRFGRSIKQPETQADACAGIVVPAFFYQVVFFVYWILAAKLDPKLLPPKDFKPNYLAGCIILFIVSYFFYGKRRKRIILEYGKLKNQRFFIGLGAVFSALTVSFPVLLWFLLLAIM